MGLTMSLPKQDQYSLSRKQILARIAMSFGGRIGEALYTDDLSTGASNDIEQATNLARRMVTEWGMSDLGPIRYTPSDSETVFIGREMGRASELSQATMQQIDAEVRRVMDEQYKVAEDLILAHRDGLVQLAEALMKHETVSGEDVQSVLDGRPLSANGNGARPSQRVLQQAAAAASEASEASPDEPASEEASGEDGAAAEAPSGEDRAEADAEGSEGEAP
jgi:cell division protease FtsH